MNRAGQFGAGADVAVIVLTLFAPALGGSTQLWAQALLALGAVALIILDPPRTFPPRILSAVLIGLILLAAITFLPATWFGSLPWRQKLLPTAGIDLPTTLTPQPLLSLETALLVAIGIFWTAYLITREWVLRLRIVLSLYAAGITLLAACSLIFFVFDWLPPFWNPKGGRFGFFPNRNQTANVLALGGIITLALAFHEFARRRDMRYLWSAAYLLIGVALVICGSRSGILLLFGGSFLWVLWTGWGRQELKYLSLEASVVLLGLTLFCTFGGKTLDRLSQLPEQNDGRILIQSDALRLLKAASWHGIGLGNFSPTYTHFRQAYTAQSRPVHPESDWLWFGIEAGWISLALLVFGLLYYLVKNRPRAGENEFKFRAAVFVAIIGFLLHGLVDVSGHRMGSLFPALLFLSLVRPPSEQAARKGQAGVNGLRFPALFYRGLAAVFALVPVWWLLSLSNLTVYPTSATVIRIKNRIKDAQAFRADTQVDRLASAGLRYAPLDWELYFARALSEVRISTNLAVPIADFDRARHLEPNVSDLPYREGAAWLMRQPRLTLGPWREALRRVTVQFASLTNEPSVSSSNRMAAPRPHAAAGLYARMLAISDGIPIIRDEVRALALDDRKLMLEFMKYASKEEFLIELQRMLLEDPDLKSLDQADRATLFGLWGRKGDREALEQALLEHPDWQQAGWFWIAANHARREEFQFACDMAQRLATPPVVPKSTLQKPIAELRTKFLMLTNDIASGFALYNAQLQAGQTNDALYVLQRVTAQRSCPKYFHYLEAQMLMKLGDWQRAWQAWLRFLT